MGEGEAATVDGRVVGDGILNLVVHAVNCLLFHTVGPLEILLNIEINELLLIT